MQIWWREVLGVLLTLGGAAIAGFCVHFLNQGWVIEAGVALFLTLIVLGAGTSLLRVALAARALERSRGAGGGSSG
ncbi:MAG: hypothetical protein HZA54_19420 [Planctomycetes bacterium]|nr:hypothetical protein [Planctomycetota bacterium]